MEKQATLRLLDELGRIGIPAGIRSILNWHSGDTLEFSVNEISQEITLKKHRYICDYCGETENLKRFKNQHICPKCLEEIIKL